MNQKYVNILPNDVMDLSYKARILPINCTGLTVPLYVTTKLCEQEPHIWFPISSDISVSSRYHLASANIITEDFDQSSLTPHDICLIKYWMESNRDLLLNYWHLKIAYNVLKTQVLSRTLKQKKKAKEIRKERKRKSRLQDSIRRNANMCYGKKVYSSFENALKVTKKIFKDRGVRLRIYACPICGLYHLTHKNVDKPREKF